jgi:hypothetical protein
MMVSLVLLVLLFHPVVYGQVKKSASQGKGKAPAHPTSKWLVGVKAGVNHTRTEVLQACSVFGQNASVPGMHYAKEYDHPSAYPGYQIGLIAGYELNRYVFLLVQPAFTQTRFGHRTRYAWTDEQGSIEIFQHHLHTLQALETPLVLRLSLPIRKFRLYAQMGGYYGILLQAGQSIRATSLEISSTEMQAFDWGTQTADNNHLNGSWKGLTGGGGLSFDTRYGRIGMECNYLKGLDNRSRENRAKEVNIVSPYYDVPDDLKLSQWEFSVAVTFPLDKVLYPLRANSNPRLKRSR